MIRLSLLLAVLISTVAAAQDMPIPAPPELDAKSYFLMDYSSSEVLAEEAADEPVDPASLTKLMTAYVVFKALQAGSISQTDSVLVSEKAWRMPGSRMFIEVDTEVPVDELLHGMIIQSGNDAAIALAEHVAGSEEAFVELMNSYAQVLGMTATRYRNPTGLTAAEHVSSARDSAVLAQAIIREFPDYYHLYSQRRYTFNEITQHNRNALLWRDDSVDGMKTGYTSAAGYCLVSSAEREGMRLIAVVMGMPSANARTAGSQSLINYGFRFYETHMLYKRGASITAAKVWKGAVDSVALGLDQDVYVTLPRGQYQDLEASMELKEDLVAPISNQQSVGTVRLRFKDKELSMLPLVSLQAVPEASFLGRVADGIKLWFE